MQALVGIFIVLMIAECIIVSAIAYKTGFHKGEKHNREMYVRSLNIIKQNYEKISQDIEEMAHDNNPSAESVQDTEGGRI